MKHFQLFLTVALGLATRLTASAQPYDFQNEEMTYPVDLKDLSHVFENVRIEDDKVMATMNILDTPKGQNVKALLESNVKLALAPRLMIDEQQKINEDGQPILDENGKPIMETKVVNLISCDIVLDKEKAFEGNTIEIE